MGQLLQFVVAGVAVGAMYGLIALGFVIIYNVTGLVNLAQGAFPMLGGLVMVSLVGAHVPILLALVIDALLVALAGIVVCSLAIVPFKQVAVPCLIVTLGLSIAFEGLALFVWSYNPLSYPPFSGSRAISFLGAAIYPQALWVILAAAVLVVLSYGFFERTFLGKAVRACAMNRRAAELAAIDVKLMAFLAFALSAALGALVGAIVTPLTTMSFDAGLSLAINGFAGAIFGGLESPMAAVAGGVVLGVIGALAQGYVGNGLDIVAALVLMLIVLVSRPEGAFAALFGARQGVA